jgi:DNA-binding transcriptional LysR family regulator
LFERSSRKVALTEPGRLFLEQCRATLAQADHAVEVARRAARGNFARFAIGFNPSAPFVPDVARAIFDFRALYPDVRIELLELSSSAQIAALTARDIDISLLRGPLPPVLPDDTIATRFLEERLHVAMRSDHRLASKKTLAFSDLHGEAMIWYARHQKGSFATNLLDLMRENGVEPRTVQDVGEVSTLFGLVAAGLGVSILAESMCALQPAKLVYRPLRGKNAQSSMWILSRKCPTAIAAQRFLEIIKPGAGSD